MEWRRRRGKLHLQRAGDRLCDLILHRKYVRHLAIVAFGPEMISVRRIDELSRDAYAAARSAHATLKDRTHIERFGDLSDVLLLSPKSKRGRASSDLQARNVRQGVDNLFGKTVAEVFVLLVRTHVGEGKHGNRGLEGGRPDGNLFQGGLQFRHRLKPLGGLFRQTAHHDALQCGGRLQRTRIVAQHGTQHLCYGVPVEGTVSRKRLIQDCAKAEDIGTLVEFFSFGLLRRHVGGRAHHRAIDRIPGDVGIHVRCRLGEPEVEQLRRSFLGDDDVCRLQIAMDDPSTVGLLERACNLNRQPYGLIRRKWTLERFAFDVLHHQIIRADVIQLANMRMVQRRDRARFLLEPLAVLTLQSLHCHDAIETCVPRFPDFAHAARANWRNQHVGPKPNAARPGAHGVWIVSGI